MVRISADSLLGLINDILDFSKIEARKLDLEHLDFDLRHALDETMRPLAPRAHQKGLELAYHVGAEVPRRGERRSGAAAPDPRQPGRQRREVHRDGRGRPPGGSGGPAAPAAGGTRRDAALHRAATPASASRRTSRPDLRARSPRPTLHHPALRGHRARPRHRVSARGASWAGGSGWRASPARGASSTSPFPSRCRPRSPSRRRRAGARPRGDAGARRRRQRDEPPHPRRDPHHLGHAADRGRRRRGRRSRRWSSRTRAGGPSPSSCSTSRCPTWTASRWPRRLRERPHLAGATIMMLSSVGQRGDAAALPGAGRGRLPHQARPAVHAAGRHPRRPGQARPWHGAPAGHA